MLITTLAALIPATKASHIVGGDITWQFQNAGSGGSNYHFKLRAFRDDVNGINLPNSITISVYNAVTHALVTSQSLSKTNPFTLVPLGDPCYTPNPSVVRIEEGIYESPTNLFVPNNSNGYYVSAHISARNSLAINVQSGGYMTWFAMMPDPAIGQNSSPDFGDYPNDAYFCTSGPKQFSYPITDFDGDSLAYKLTQPLAGPNGAGSGAYPFYNGLNWTGGYSLANIVGGSPAMNVNPATGLITAAPVVQGFFTFAITVEEFRDTTAAQNGPKVKIGETRRDVQYISLNCTSGSPPSFLNTVPQMNQTIQIPYNYEYCKDLIFNDINSTDTLYFTWNSPIFDSGAYQANVPLDMSGNQHYFYNWNGTAWGDSVVIPPNQFDTVENAEWNIGTVAQRFCWTPDCDDIGKTFPFQVNAYSLGCDGKSQDSILFNLEVVPPPTDLKNPGDKEIPYGAEYCRNIVFEDSTIVDLIDITVTSDIFTMGAEIPALPTNYNYVSWVDDDVVTGVSNNSPNHYAVATRICWTPDCEHIGGTFPVRAVLSSKDCPEAIQDTIDFSYTVTPPFDSLDVIPNVITPNGDGMNDIYTLGYINDQGVRVGGVSNPCTDEIKVEIFNRWGNKVYDGDNPEFTWDGTYKGGGDVPAGTYFILIHGIYGNETVTLDQRTVTVLR